MTSDGSVIYPGIQSGILNVNSSSVYDSSFSPYRCQFDYQIREGSSCWGAASNDLNQYLQLSSPICFNFHAIVTAGRPDADQWITTYSLAYTIDGSQWLPYNEGEILRGNTDRNTRVEHQLIPFLARAVRIKPLTWSTHISLRVELFISDAAEFFQRCINDVLIPAIELGVPVKVSSVWDSSYDASRIRINYSGNREGGNSWISSVADLNQWVLITTIIPKQWFKISLQGRGASSQWISKFYLSYTFDGKTWHLYNGGEKIAGNKDQSSVVDIELKPFIARSIKFHPAEWVGHISMRIEAYFKDI